MSKKHQQRTRAEILAKRERPIPTIAVMKKIPVPPAAFAMVPVETIDARMRRRANASKYTPHFGAKQAEKLAPRHA